MRINRRALHGVLQTLSRVADPRSTLAAYQHVHLVAADGKLVLTATDGDRTLTADLPCDGDLPETCLPVKPLTTLSKPESKGSDGDVVIDVDDQVATIIVDGVTSKLATFPVEDFPAGNEDDFSLVAFWPAAPLAESLAFCLPTVCTDVTRPHIASLCLHEVMASTDGHRLHICPLPTQLQDELLVPLQSAQVLQRILKGASGNIIIARSEDRVKMRVGIFTLESKVTDATFPPIDQVIPKGHETRIVVDAAGFSKALKKVGSLSSDRLKGVRMTINGVIELSSSEEDCESKVMVTPLENNHDAETPDIVLGVNMAYMVDALARDKGQVTMEFGKPLDPILVRHEDDRLSVVMPMRV